MIKNPTLRENLLLLTLLPSALITLILVAYFGFSGLQSQEEGLAGKGLSTVRLLAPVSEYGLIAGDVGHLQHIVQASMQEPDVKAAIIVDPQGKVLAVTGRTSLSMEELRTPLEAPGKVAETDVWVAFGAPVRRTLFEDDFLLQSQPENSAIGHVFVEFDKQKITARLHRQILQGILVLLLGLGTAAWLAITMAHRLAAPLQGLARAVRKISAGHLDTRVPACSQGELRVLEDGFNDMSARIEEMHHAMQAKIDEATAQLVFQANHDPLTGLPNRREFERRLECALDALRDGRQRFTLLYIDLDRFKPVNDSCGHLAGDELLRQIAMLFKGCIRQEDTLARLGGDEFGVLLGDCDEEQGMQVATKLRDLAAEYRFLWEGRIFSIGASIGLTCASAPGHGINELLSAADSACLEAKALGRNQICEGMVEQHEGRRRQDADWVPRLEAALLDGSFRVDALPLQPREETVGEAPMVEFTGYLREASGEQIQLPALMDIAERYKMSSLIDRHFLTMAIAAMGRAQRAGLGLNCLVPVSPGAIASTALTDFIAERLLEEGLSGCGLCLVLPEELVTRRASQMGEFVLSARQLGCRIVLEHFGGSLISFNLLHSIRPDFVKLASALTRDMANRHDTRPLLQAMLEIAADQGIRSIAGDIDDYAALRVAQSMPVDYLQGQAVAVREPFVAWLEGAVMRGRE